MRFPRGSATACQSLSRRQCIAQLVLGAAFGPQPARSQPPDDVAAIRRLIRDASRALQAGNAPLFLAALDREQFPGMEAFGEALAALTAQRRIASSVESSLPVGGPEEWTVRVDWLLDLTHKIDPGPVERRKATLTVTVRKRREKWRIVRLEPQSFFAALPVPSRQARGLPGK